MSEKFYYFGQLQKVIEEHDLSVLEIKLYCKIANLPHGCFATQKSIAEWLGCTREWVGKNLKKLEQLQLIEMIEGAWVITHGRVKSSSHKCEEKVTKKRAQVHTPCEEQFTNDVNSSSHTTNIYNTRSRSTEEEAHPLEELFLKKDGQWENSNEHMAAGRRPLKNYPLIFLHLSELKDILEDAEAMGIKSKFARNLLFKTVEKKLKEHQELGKFTTGKAPTWLTGWALTDTINKLKASNQLASSEAHLARVG